MQLIPTMNLPIALHLILLAECFQPQRALLFDCFGLSMSLRSHPDKHPHQEMNQMSPFSLSNFSKFRGIGKENVDSN